MLLTWPPISIDIKNNHIANSVFWSSYLALLAKQPNNTVSVHVAILKKTYLKKILAGEKTVESRFSKDRRPPFNRVKTGDIILLKESGGFITGISYAQNIHEVNIKTYRDLQLIKEVYNTRLGVDESFWLTCATASYATLIELNNVLKLEPIEYVKKDQRSWVILQKRHEDSIFTASSLDL